MVLATSTNKVKGIINTSLTKVTDVKATFYNSTRVFTDFLTLPSKEILIG